MPSHPAVLLAINLTVLSSMLFCGCSAGPERNVWRSPEGVVVRWSPPEPEIGDLVTVVALYPAAHSGFGSEHLLSGPDGQPISPVSIAFVAFGQRVTWSFRLKRAGEWAWVTGSGPTPVRQTLWSAQTVAGDAKELKKIEPKALWAGRGKLKAQAGNTGGGAP